jgi:hypothetical protein
VVAHRAAHLDHFPIHFLALINDYADGRKYVDDDATATLSKLGLSQADFTVNTRRTNTRWWRDCSRCGTSSRNM